MKDTLPASWQMTTIGRVADVIPGYAFKSKDWCDAGIPVIKIKNIVGDLTVNTGEADCVPNDIMIDRLNKYILRDRDMLIAMTGATAGKTGRLKCNRSMLLNQRVAKLQPRSINADFFWAIISSQEYQSRFFYLADGAAQPNMSGGQIEGVAIPEPPPTTQRKIASILSAYDDLIENNTRRIAILEEMAQAIYREWFVNFRFPGHENVKLVDSTLGMVPEGWRAGTLDDCCDFQEGYVNPSQKYPEYFGDEIKWLRAVDLNNSFVFETTRSLSQIGFDSAGKSKLLFEPDTLAISKSGTIGRIGILKDYMCGNRAVINIKPQRNICGNQFIFHTLLVHNREIVQLATGSVQKNLYVSVLGAQKIVIPTPDILREFEQRISPFADGIATNQRKSSTLRATRDLLLPKLISGQLDVEDLDIDVGMTAEELAEAAAG